MANLRQVYTHHIGDLKVDWVSVKWRKQIYCEACPVMGLCFWGWEFKKYVKVFSRFDLQNTVFKQY